MQCHPLPILTLILVAVSLLPASYAQTPQDLPILAGAVFITQQALDDGPERYANLLQQAVQEVIDDAHFNDIHCSEDTCKEKFDAWAYFEHVNITANVSDLQLQIVDLQGRPGITFVATVHLLIRNIYVSGSGEKCEAKIFGDCFLCGSFSCQDNTVVTVAFPTQANGQVIYLTNATGNFVDATVAFTPPPVDEMDVQMDPSCHVSTLVDLYLDFCERSFLQALVDYEKDIAAQLNAQLHDSTAVPQSYSPYANVTITYIPYNYTVATLDYIMVLFTADVAVVDPTGQTHHYPPDPTLNVWPQLGNWPRFEDNSGLAVLVGARFSAIFLQASLWAGNYLSSFEASTNLTILDANLTVELLTDQPSLTVVADNLIDARIASGLFYLQCETPGRGCGDNLVNITWANVTADANVTYTNNSRPGVQLFIKGFDVSQMTIHLYEPRFPLSEQVAVNVIKDALQQSVPIANTYLATYALVLPDQLIPLLPHPTVNLIDQGAGAGYIELLTLCQCHTGIDAQWPVCSGFTCGADSWTQLQNTWSRPSMDHSLLAHNDPLSSNPCSDASSMRRRRHAADAYAGSATNPLRVSVALTENTFCGFEDATGTLTVLTLPDSGGECLQADEESYYLIEFQDNPSHFDDITTLRMNCNASCAHDDTHVTVGVLCADNCTICSQAQFPLTQCLPTSDGSLQIVKLSGGCTHAKAPGSHSAHAARAAITAEILVPIALLLLGALAVFYRHRQQKRRQSDAKPTSRSQSVQDRTPLLEGEENHDLAASSMGSRFLAVLARLGRTLLFQGRRALAWTLTMLPRPLIGRPHWTGWTSLGCHAIATLALVLLLVFWYKHDPFTVFNEGIFGQVGLDASDFDASTLAKAMRQWSRDGFRLLLASFLVYFVVLVSSVVFHPRFDRWLAALRYGSLGILLFLVVGILVGPPLYVPFASGVHVIYKNDSDPSSNWISSDNSTRTDISQGLGLAVASLGISFLALLLLPLLYGILAGVTMGSSAFLMLCLAGQCQERLVQYFASRLHALCWSFFLVIPMAGSLALVILYQTFSAALAWLLLIPSAWFLQFVGMQLQLGAFHGPRRALSTLVNALCHLISVVLFVLALTDVRQRTDLDMGFHLASAVTVTLLTGALTVAALVHTLQLQDDRYRERRWDADLTNILTWTPLPASSNAFLDSLEACCFAIPIYFGRTFPRLHRAWHWFEEHHEMQEPERYGLRVPHRRMFFAAGVIAETWLVWSGFHDMLRFDAKSLLIHEVRSFGYNLTWPDADNGGTVFDEAFSHYDAARRDGWYLTLFGWITLLLALLIDVLWPSRRSLFASRCLELLALILSTCGALATAVPNYLQDIHVTDVINFCAPKFNRAISLFLSNTMGLVCAGLFTVTLLPIFLALGPALVRASKLILTDDRLRNKSRNPTCVSDVAATVKNPGEAEPEFASGRSGPSQTHAGASQALDASAWNRSLIASQPSAATATAVESEHTPLLGATAPLKGMPSRATGLQHHGKMLGFGLAPVAWLRAEQAPDMDVFERVYAENVLLVYRLTAFLMPVTTVLPLFVVSQFFGDHFTRASIIAFWLAPCIIGLATTWRHMSTGYLAWLTGYFAPLFAIFLYEMLQHHFEHAVQVMLQKPDFWFELVAEICLANVVISGMVFAFPCAFLCG
ncbi:uncharacterized protein MONBRDRAFT_10910 [Monosiga brevicollis MX1]|uniref:Uncharacterized protein n=1 Tax=Monosiga brevicollis TaxID=81824 RepID=A9V7L4_MONBE|nr:uncharacterized protein MONBRDRAFT_10910 [Monosiga brevicollis MX1]EDQ86603.1 predicted protein [Monosiga brevicollis MX1]|eukprot:XP_001748716.1 hypothetical protein [Monosiga brevicollis MX1]